MAQLGSCGPKVLLYQDDDTSLFFNLTKYAQFKFYHDCPVLFGK